MLLLPWVVMFLHVHFEPLSVPRKPSMAPTKTSCVSSGVAATTQSYVDCSTSIFGSVTRVQVDPVLLHKYAPVSVAPKAYATSGDVVTRSTPIRDHDPAGEFGSGMLLNVPPELVDTKRPSANATRISTDPPPGSTL